MSLFDGKTLDGWKVGENADLFQVRDGMIVMECPATIQSPAHLFYVGDVNHHDFKNFDLKVDVMTFPKANSGIYFHTKYQESDWPKFRDRMPGQQQSRRLAQDRQPVGHQEHLVGARKRRPRTTRKTSPFCRSRRSRTTSGIPKRSSTRTGRSRSSSTARQCSSTRFPHADVEHKIPNNTGTWLPRGTFALQGHPPMPGHISKACFKNIRVKVLPD